MVNEQCIVVFSLTSYLFFYISLFTFIIISILLLIHSKLKRSKFVWLVITIIISLGHMHSYSCRNAHIKIDNTIVSYTGCFLTEDIQISKIQEIKIITTKEFPRISHKKIGYATKENRNGLFISEDGKNIYIAGNSDYFLYIKSPDVDMLFAVGDNGLSQDFIDYLSLKVKQVNK